MIKLFLDCDPGIDDAVALGYVLCQEDVDVVGIGASGGNVPTDQIVTNTLGWLQLGGRSDIPVHAGAPLPLARTAPANPESIHPESAAEPEDAADTHGPTGTGYAELPKPTTTPSPTPAAEAWVEAARRHPGELIGVVTGPCTNLALALHLEPELPRLIKRLFIMGGAFNYRGNTKPTTEWNTDFDPEAAHRVFSAFGTAEHLPVIGPIEATEAVVMTPDRLERITSGATDPRWSPWLAQLAQALRFYFEFHQADGHGYLAQIHDPFVLATALQWARETTAPGSQAQSTAVRPVSDTKAGASRPEGERGFPAPETGTVPWAETQSAAVDVELTGTLTRGETVADWLGRWGKTPNAELVRRLDAESFLNHLETTLMRGPSYDHAR